MQIKGTLLIGISLVLSAVADGRADSSVNRPNVLFIAIDDLRNDLGCLGVEHARTPHLDALASSGRLFSRHYVQAPTCGASRCALLRGRYPEERAHVNNGAIRTTHEEWGSRSLPAWFRQHGYQSLALGKITHHPGGRTGRNWAEGPKELPGAWDRSWIPDSPWETPLAMMHGYANGVPRTRGESPPWEAFDGPDKSYPDAWVADDAVTTLRELASSEEPWFFAVGFFKPHLPFAAPKKWYDLHDPDDIPPPAVTERPSSPSGWHGSGEFRGNYGHAGRDPDNDPEYARLMRQGYAAATSYVDAQVGRVLQAVDELDLGEDTIIVVWGDHGFLLGEHAIWGKHCLYDQALRSPLIIRHPGMVQPGRMSDALVETVDLFPTLIDLCGLPTPDGLDGQSLRPQLNDPETTRDKPAFGFWRKGQRTVRTDRWRLVVHPEQRQEDGTPGFELFDYQNDPHEAENLATKKPQVVARLRALLDRVPDHARQ